MLYGEQFGNFQLQVYFYCKLAMLLKDFYVSHFAYVSNKMSEYLWLQCDTVLYVHQWCHVVRGSRKGQRLEYVLDRDT